VLNFTLGKEILKKTKTMCCDKCESREELKYLPFVEWLWSKRGVDKYFHIGVLLDTNTDTTLPRPALSVLESDNLFSWLQEKGLASEKEIIGKDIYRLNTVDEYKWKEMERSLSRPYWRRSWWWTDFKKLPYYLAGLFLAALIGGYIQKVGEKAYTENLIEKKIKEFSSSISAGDPKNAPKYKPTQNIDGNGDKGAITAPTEK
jgi:hypothetical protein